MLVGLTLLALGLAETEGAPPMRPEHPVARAERGPERSLRPPSRTAPAPQRRTADAPTRSRSVTGPVTHVRDGDTIEVSGVPVRIANLDCAETGTRTGEIATARVRRLVARARMDCALSGRKSYDRHVGTCALPDGRDLGEVLIAEGTCARWRWR